MNGIRKDEMVYAISLSDPIFGYSVAWIQTRVRGEEIYFNYNATEKSDPGKKLVADKVSNTDKIFCFIKNFQLPVGTCSFFKDFVNHL